VGAKLVLVADCSVGSLFEHSRLFQTVSAADGLCGPMSSVLCAGGPSLLSAGGRRVSHGDVVGLGERR